MASNAGAVFATAPLAGIDLDSKSSTLAHRLLTKVFASDGHTHLYVRASEALASTDTINVRSLGSASSDSGSAGYDVNTTGGVAAGQAFWARKTSLA